MINKKIILGVSMFTVAGALMLSPKEALAYQGDYTKKGPNCTPERHESMTKAFEDNDYEAWAELMSGRGRVTQIINASNFPRFAEAHRLAQEGKYEEADKIREELGLRTRNGGGMGVGYRQGNGQRNGN